MWEYCCALLIYISASPKDMVAHYLTHVFPNGYKAQVVATSREAAVRYKTYIDEALADAIVESELKSPLTLPSPPRLVFTHT